MKVLVSNIMMLNERERFASELTGKGIEAVFPVVDQFLNEQECCDLMGEFDGWLAGDDQITRKVLDEALPRLKVISKWGTGVDSIDLKAADELGVDVFRSAGAFGDAVAEVAIGYMLDLSRHISYTDRSVRAGGWPKPVGTGLVGKTLGLIGFGAIGRGIAQRALGMKMSVMAYDPYSEDDTELDVQLVTNLNSLCASSDYVCLCCNLTDENRNLINAELLREFKNSAALINVARGPLVDETALIEALESGHIGGAGLDVYESEPLGASSPLVNLDNVVLGSHNANNLAVATEFVHANTLSNLYAGLGIT